MRKLYHFWRCPYCVRTRIVLDEKEIEYESIEVDLKDKPQALLERNAKGKVPVFEDDGLVLYESHIIDEYLDERYPKRRLMPETPADRARVRLLHDFCDTELTPTSYVLAKELLFKKDTEKRDEDVVRAARSKLFGHLERLDNELAGKDFLVEEFGLADITFAPWVVGLDRLGIQADELPSDLANWIERLRSRPSVRRQTQEQNG